MAGLSPKLLLAPAVMLGLKYLNIDLTKPTPLLTVRLLFVVSSLLVIASFGSLHRLIKGKGDDRRKVKIKDPRTNATQQLTFQQYDSSELAKLARSTLMGYAITVLVHYKWQVPTALILQTLAVPLTVVDHALFKIYVRGHDADKDPALKRPFPEASPFGGMTRQTEESQGDDPQPADSSPLPPLPPARRTKKLARQEAANTVRQTSSAADSTDEEPEVVNDSRPNGEEEPDVEVRRNGAAAKVVTAKIERKADVIRLDGPRSRHLAGLR